MIDVLLMTDGRRDCIERTIASARDSLHGPILTWWIHDDSGDPDYRDWLEQFNMLIIGSAGRSGFGGAIRSAWRHLREFSQASMIFHLEDDFIFRRPIPLDVMADVLALNPHLVQLALRRQPWNAHERLAGGIVEQHPHEYSEITDDLGRTWLEHRLFFTTNPTLYRRDLIESEEWPDADQSEGRFSERLLGDADLRFAYWGERSSGEWVHHIGRTRVGSGY